MDDGLEKRVKNLELKMAKKEEVLDYLKFQHQEEVNRSIAERQEIWNGINQLRENMNSFLNDLRREIHPISKRIYIIVGVGMTIPIIISIIGIFLTWR